MSDRAANDAGFTLIEALVAMVILGLGAVSLLTAAEGHTGRITEVSDRVAARWVAENALAEAQLGLPISAQDIAMNGQRFDLRQTAEPTDDPNVTAVQFSVLSVGTERVMFVLDGYIATENLR